MRNLLIIIDATKSSKIGDFKPSRLAVTLKYLPVFELIIRDIYWAIFRVKSTFTNWDSSCRGI
jgi:hypothetical protein